MDYEVTIDAQELLRMIGEVQRVLKPIQKELIAFTEEKFVMSMCMLFDEYHNAHREADAVALAAMAYKLTEEINRIDGNYETGGIF